MLRKPDVIHVSLVHVVCTRRLRQSLPLSLSFSLFGCPVSQQRGVVSSWFFLTELFQKTAVPPPSRRPWLIFIFRINEDRSYQRPRQSQRLSLEFKHVRDMLGRAGHYHLLHLVCLPFLPSSRYRLVSCLTLSRFFPLVSSSSSFFSFRRNAGCP